MKRAFIVLLISVSMCLVMPAKGQTFAARYAYMIASNHNSLQLALVDPLQPSNSPQLVALNLPNIAYLPNESIASPDGNWLLFSTLNANNTPVTILFEIATGQIHEITEASLDGRDAAFIGPEQDAVWSPNSQYIALVLRNSIPQDDRNTDVFVYNLSNNTLTQVTNDSFRNHRVVWSPDSGRLATTTDECYVGIFNCSHRIEVFNIPTNTLATSTDYSEIGTNSGGEDTTCQLDWSPDGRYISFIAGCRDTSAPFSPSEVYIWDTTSSGLQQITNYTAEFTSDPTSIYVSGIYDTVWYNSQKLLVGEFATRDYNVSNNRTSVIAYDVTNSTTLTLANIYADFLTVNPISQEIAFRSIPSFNANLIPQTPAVQINTFTGSALNALINTTGGCELTWQPSGNILASVSYETTECRGSVQAITFINRANSNISNHFPQANGGATTTSIIPIGWVVIQSVTPPITCNFTSSSVAQLRTDIGTANSNGTPDTICLNPSVMYSITDAPSGYNADGSNGLPSITSDITLIGNGGTATIERASGSPNFRLLRVASGGTLTLNNVIVQGGNAGTNGGGGVRNLGTLTLLNNSKVQNSSAAGGGGIYNLNGTVTIGGGSQITGNTSTSSGGGLYNNGGTITLDGATISNNTANTSSGSGGGIYNSNNTLTTQGNTTITTNTARLGGGIYLTDTGSHAVNIQSGTTLLSNTSTNNGGGVYINNGTVTIGSASTGLAAITSNVATNSGSGIYQSGGNLTLQYCNISSNGNTTTVSGGGIRANSTLTVNNCTFANNLVNITTGLGAGIYINSASTIAISNTTISNNPATAAARNGTGLFVSGTSTVTISGSTFTGNRAQHIGGGLFLDLGNTASVTTTTFNNNSAVDQGGAVANYGTLTLTTSNLTNNNGGSYGGALVNDNSTTGDSVSQTCITGNTATNGSAFYSFSATFNAENNWWGSASGAGTSVNSNVDAAPFLTSCPH